MFKWYDGSQYKGEYHDNLKHGMGEYKYPDGKVYEGSWEDGKRHGKGILKGTNG